MSEDYRNCADILAATAAAQGGFFTATQAISAGYADSQHVYHVKTGHWEKVLRGIYRLAAAPRVAWPELIVWSLWSRDRDGAPQGVYSHETALQIHGALERQPGPLHMTVPRRFRKNTDLPADLILHKEDLSESDVESRSGYQVVALRRALAETSDHPAHELISGQARHLPQFYARYAPVEPDPGAPRSYDDAINAGED